MVSSESLRDKSKNVHYDSATYDESKSILDEMHPEMFETNYDCESDVGNESEGHFKVDWSYKKQVRYSIQINIKHIYIYYNITIL